MTIMRNLMHTGAKPAVDVRELILTALRDHPFRPAELLEYLQSREVSEARLKNELAALIDEHIVQFSPDRYIRLRANEQAAAS